MRKTASLRTRTTARAGAAAIAVLAVSFLCARAGLLAVPRVAVLSCAASGVVVLMAWAWGRALARWAPLREEGSRSGPWERAALHFVLGIGVLGLLLFFASAAHVPGRWTLLLALAGGLGAAWVSRHEPRVPAARRAGWFALAPRLLTLAPVFAVALPAALPPIAWFDALEYHLVLPAQNLIEGGLVDRPDNLFSHLPHSIELVDGLVFAFGRSLRPGPFHWAVGLAAAILLSRLVRRHLHPSAGPLAAAIFFASADASMSIFAEGADLAFTAAAILAVDFFLGSRHDPRLLPAAFLTVGFACSFKVPAIGVVVALALALVLVGRDRLRGGGARRILLSCALFLATLLPWGVLNLIRHGNPVHPFFPSLFGGTAEDGAWLAWMNSYTRAMAIDEGDPLRFPAAFLRVLFDPTQWNPLPLAALLLPLAPGRARARVEAAVVTAILFLCWEIESAFPTYGLPAWAMLSALAAATIASLLSRIPRVVFRQAAFLALCAVLVVGGVSCVINTLSSRDFVAYLIGAETELEYENRTIPNSPRALFRWINENLPQEIRILSLDEPRVFGLWRSCDAASVFDRRVLRRFLRGGSQDTSDQVAERIRGAGFTHLLTNPAYADTWLAKIGSPYGYNASERAVINALLNQEAGLVRTEGSAALWELRTKGDAAQH